MIFEKEGLTARAPLARTAKLNNVLILKYNRSAAMFSFSNIVKSAISLHPFVGDPVS